MTFTTRRALMAQAILAGCAVLAAGPAAAQAYPNKPIQIIVGFAAGSTTDIVTRVAAEHLRNKLGQPVVVVNKPGASGIIGSTQVINAAPDGYTLLLARPGSQAILPAIQPVITKYKWDDFTPIGLLELNPYGCVVKATSPYRTISDFVAGLRERGKQMNFGTAGVLTTNDMGPRQLLKLLNLIEKPM